MSTSKKGGGGYNYRDSGNGQYLKERDALRKPPETVERERRSPPPTPKKK